MDLNQIAQCWFAQFQFPTKCSCQFAFVLISTYNDNGNGIDKAYTNANNVIIITDSKLLNVHKQFPFE